MPCRAQTSSFSFRGLQNTSLLYAPREKIICLATQSDRHRWFLPPLKLAQENPRRCPRLPALGCKSADAKMKTAGVQKLQSRVLRREHRLATACLAPNLFNLKDGDFLLSFKRFDCGRRWKAHPQLRSALTREPRVHLAGHMRAWCGQGTILTGTINFWISFSLFAQALGVDVYSTVLAFNSFGGV